MRIAGDPTQLLEQLVPINVDQYEVMMRTGIISEGSPIELLDGMLVRKDRSARGEDILTIGNDHIFGVDALNHLNKVLPDDVYLRPQQPIQIPPQHEPEPDAAIVIGSHVNYRGRKPQAEEVLCIVEVSDSSLQFDRTTKRAIYASAGVPQYVILNLIDRVAEVFTTPNREHRIYGGSVVITPVGVIQLNLGKGRTLDVNVRDLLP